MVDEADCLFAEDAWAEDCGIEDGGCWRNAAKKLERKGRWGDMVGWWCGIWVMFRTDGRCADARARGRKAAGWEPVMSSGCGRR